MNELYDKTVNDGNNNHVNEAIYYIYSFHKPKYTQSLYERCIIAHYSQPQLFLNNQKKMKSNNGDYSCQVYLKQDAHSRLIKLMEFSAELRNPNVDQESCGFVL